MSENTLLFPWLAAAVELLFAGVFETRIVLGVGRTPSSHVLAAILRYVPRPRAKPWQEVLVAGALLAFVQIFPMGREGIWGDRTQADHIGGAGVIAAEILFGLWLWFGTHWDRAAD
jgi:hypothetical protein